MMKLFLLIQFITCSLCQLCSNPLTVFNTAIQGYCVVDNPYLVQYGQDELVQLQGLTQFTLTLWFLPDTKVSGRSEQALFRVAGDPSDVVSGTIDGVRLGMFFSASTDQNTYLRIQYSTSLSIIQEFFQQFQYVEQKWIFIAAGLDYVQGVVSYYAWQPYSPTLRINPQTIKVSSNFHTQLPPTTKLQLMYWGKAYKNFCGSINNLRWIPNYVETGYLHNWMNLAFYNDGQTVNVIANYKLEDRTGQYIRDSSSILNKPGVLGATNAVENGDPVFTTTELKFSSGQFATIPAPLIGNTNLAYGVSLWFKTDATITGDGDSADLTNDLVLLKRYFGNSIEVFGLMINQGSDNQYTTKLKLHGVIQNLPQLQHTKNIWHLMSIRIAYPGSVNQLNIIMFDIVMEDGVFIAHVVTQLKNTYQESINDIIVLGSSQNSFSGSLFMSRIMFFDGYTLYTQETTNQQISLQCISNCQIQMNTPLKQYCLRCINGAYEDFGNCINSCIAGPTAITNYDLMSCQNCDFKCQKCGINRQCTQCSSGYYLVTTLDDCVISSNCGKNLVGDSNTQLCTLCGNSIKDTGEMCDDGNFIKQDGCSQCQIDTGYKCLNDGQLCILKCGDGFIDSGEQCDDQNNIASDGCTNCLIDDGWECIGTTSICNKLCGNGNRAGIEQCDDGNDEEYDGCFNCQIELGWECNGNNPDICKLLCGNQIVDFGEQCDDGNMNLGDGCSNCVIDPGWECNDGIVCIQICGNGVRDIGEQCDDGNNIAGDGCTSCKIDINYICNGGSSNQIDICVLIPDICGDGRKKSSEGCDDGNLVNSDGCNNQCLIEVGWICKGGSALNQDICQFICGDGIRVGTEQCDDGNLINGDGCNNQCQIEPLYNCQYIQVIDICKYTCGNSIIDNIYEQCDDGNNNQNDGCSNICQIEIGWQCIKTDFEDSYCFQCINGCINCLPNQCQNCQIGLFLDINNQCQNQCDIGYFQNSNQGKCEPCPNDCSICPNLQCTQCNINKYLFNNKCYSTCPQGYYIDQQSNQCLQCQQPCIQCNNLNNCLQCDQMYYLDTSKLICIPCNMGQQCIICQQGQCLQCINGYYPIEDQCDIIPLQCGDGLHHPQETCDDGNLQNGDGCSSNCKSENNWNCILENPQGPDVCYELVPPKLTLKINQAFFDRIYLEFNRPLRDNKTNFNQITLVSIPALDEYKQKLLFSPDENGIVYIYNESSIFLPYLYNIIQPTPSRVEIYFDFYVTIFQLNVIINITQPANVIDKFNWTLAGDSILLNRTSMNSSTNPFYKDYVIIDGPLPYFIYYQQNELLIFNIIAYATSGIAIIGSLSSLFYAVQIGEGKNLKFIEILQMISALRFLLWRYGANLEQTLQILSYFNGSFIFNLFALLLNQDKNIDVSDPFKFQQFQFSGQFLFSAGGRFIIWMLLLGILTLIVEIFHLLIHHPSIQYYIDYTREYLYFSAYIRIFEILYFELIISIILQLKNVQISDVAQQLGISFAVITLFIISIFFFLVSKYCVFNAKLTRVQSFYGRFGVLFDSLSFESPLTKIYSLIPYIQKFFVAIILIFVTDAQNQIIFLIVIRLAPFIPTFFFQPFSNEYIYKKDLYYELAFLTILLTTLGFKDFNTTKDNKITMGWFIIACINLFTLLQTYWLCFALRIIEKVAPQAVPDHEIVKDDIDSERDDISTKQRKKKLQQHQKIQQVRQMEEDFFNAK